MHLDAILPNHSIDMPTLAGLPAELLWAIHDLLPLPSRIAMRLTSREISVRLSLHNDTSKADSRPCDRRAAMRYLEEAELTRLSQRRCILCGAVQSVDFFRDETPKCRWHDGWFVTSQIEALCLEAWVGEIARKVIAEGRSLDLLLQRTYCAHARDVVGWFVDDCKCGCVSCGHFEVWCRIQSPVLKKKCNSVVHQASGSLIGLFEKKAGAVGCL